MRAIAAMVCIAATQFVACDYVREKAPSPSHQETQNLSPITIPDDEPLVVLQNALSAQLHVSSLRVRRTDSNLSATRTVVTEWTPGRTHSIPIEQIPDSDPPLEKIEIEGATYEKFKIALFWTWWRQKNYPGRKIPQPNIFRDIARFKDKNGTFAGIEDLDGVQPRSTNLGQRGTT